MSTYTIIKQSGLCDGNMIVHPVYDKIIPLNQFNTFFFGTISTPVTTCNALLMLNDYVINSKGVQYVVLSKLDKIIHMIGDLDKYSDRYIHINYNHFQNKELPDFHNNIYRINMQFIAYLEKKKPLYHTVIIETLGKKYFNGRLAAHELNTNMMSILYNHIMITYGITELDNDLYVNMNKPDYKKLYTDIKDQLLYEDPDTFVAFNLTKITGNKSFAKLLVCSHNNKNTFHIPIDIVNSIISFKNDDAMKQYIEHFTTIYPNKTLWDTIDGYIHFNFEGLNKYFLNLESNDLASNMKETICDFYYSIANELINSYKSLYKHTCG